VTVRIDLNLLMLEFSQEETIESKVSLVVFVSVNKKEIKEGKEIDVPPVEIEVGSV